jgi:hypothetical protein
MRLSFTPKRVLLLLVAVTLTIAFGAYLERITIARHFADAEFAARKVDARYEIKAIGPRTQRLEHVVLGNPMRPDLTADWAEIELGLGLSGVKVRSVRASGVRLRGQFANGALSFGVVDRLLPKPSGEPFTLPDIDIGLYDALLSLETKYGAFAVQLDGKGNLQSGFSGKLVAHAPRVTVSGLEGKGLTGRLAVSTDRRRIRFAGPVSADNLDFAGNALRNATVRLRGSSSESFDDVEASWLMDAAVERLAYAVARRVHADGRFKLDGTGQRVAAQLQVEGAKPSPMDRARLVASLPIAAGTPVEPLLRQLRAALVMLDKGAVATAPLEYRASGAERSLFVGPPTVIAASGARILGNGRGFVVPFDRGRPTFDGEFALSGGGFPQGTARLALVEGNWTGSARFRPYRANGAQLALTPMDLQYGKAGLSLKTVVSLDGPLGNGRVEGLNMPVALRPGRGILSGCFAPRFRSLDVSGLHLAPASLDVCINGSGIRISPLSLAGRLGESSIVVAAKGVGVSMARGSFTVTDLAVRIGPPDRRTLLDVSEFSGSFGDGRATGLFSQASGEIANVPLKMSDARGDWQFSGGALTLGGELHVADGVPTDPRFNPLVSDDFSLRLTGNSISAKGTAREPKTMLRVADIRISHDLDAGAGYAILDVPDLTFGRTLQPEMLTTTTLGVIANVVGTVTGSGEIRWDPKGVTSSGRFLTDSLDMAAAFGPVTGLKGEIGLSDLLGLVTGPGQRVEVASINPGIAVIDGDIRYRLLPGFKLRIEGGRWPFAGGWLILEPTDIDLSEAAERRLTFRVDGLDAGQFINQLQFENIDATGVFDGTLPMIFDETGGRIEGGRLVARSGGTLAYVGEISNQNLGTMGRVAFDALKSLRYHRLSIDLNGPLDGDVVTRVSFAGVNQAPIEGVRAKLPIPVRVTGLTNFPFIFNVTITAPFRKLFDMSRTISDPSLLIERLNPDLQRIGPAKTIQPPESEPMR